MHAPLHIVLDCALALVPKVQYVFDTLLLVLNVRVVYASHPPSDGIWLFYGDARPASWSMERCVTVLHSPESWRCLSAAVQIESTAGTDGLMYVLPVGATETPQAAFDIRFDLVANAFYFLSSWEERGGTHEPVARRLYSDSVYARLGVPQDIVDQYLERLAQLLGVLCQRFRLPDFPVRRWPNDALYALVLSHDVDFIPTGLMDTFKQGAKTLVRHLVRERDPADAARAAVGLVRALVRGEDPYGCIPAIIARERDLGVHSSFQVAVGHRHPNDVNYRIEDDRVRNYLRAILDAGFDLCLHGSYRSTEDPAWYLEEVELLAQRLARPIGCRQHYLSFDYDALFSVQERAGIQFDMSLGYPDRPGARAGFSYPFFPYCLKEDRPYNVLQISLFLMDVTLRSYLGLKARPAWDVVADVLAALQRKGGCASAVWHPIVFGGARDPGYQHLFWEMIEHLQRTRGLATDGRTINRFWRRRAESYASFGGCKSGEEVGKRTVPAEC
jgi:hypothetical protein